MNEYIIIFQVQVLKRSVHPILKNLKKRKGSCKFPADKIFDKKLLQWTSCTMQILYKHQFNLFKGLCHFFVPTTLEGEELYTQMVFFVQTILADRYIHRRELRLVSLESLSSVEYWIKKIFLIFVFYRKLSRFKFWENRVNSSEILFTFCGIFD